MRMRSTTSWNGCALNTTTTTTANTPRIPHLDSLPNPLTLPRISSSWLGRATMVEEVANHKEKGEILNNGWRRDCRLGPRRKVEFSNRDFPALVDTSGVQMRFFGTRTIRSNERDCFCCDSECYEIQTNNRHWIYLENLLFIRTSRKRLTDWTSSLHGRTGSFDRSNPPGCFHRRSGVCSNLSLSCKLCLCEKFIA